MKRILMASVALIALGAGVASAADLPMKAPPAPVYVPPPFTWTGCYIGGNVGGAWGKHDWNDTLFGLNWSNDDNNGRFIGGGQVGCNYQFNSFVIGAEGDFDWAANNNNNNNTGIIGPLGHSFAVTGNDAWIATAAARFGWAWDRALFYVKGGGGWIHNNGFTITDLTTGASLSGNTDNTRSGWLVGAGIEYAFYTNWTIKVEYDYLGLNSQSFTVPGVVIPALAGDTFNSGHNNVQMVKVGFNYLFNWGSPVVARY
jgi:outer membrane immunogenic protein